VFGLFVPIDMESVVENVNKIEVFLRKSGQRVGLIQEVAPLSFIFNYDDGYFGPIPFLYDRDKRQPRSRKTS
jgi:hypothetical protein